MFELGLKNCADGKNAWQTVLLSDCIVMNDSTYSPKEAWPFVNYLDTGNITENHISEIQTIIGGRDKLPTRARRKVKAGDIVYSTVRPNQRHFGLVKEALPNFLVSTGFAVIRGKDDKAITDFIYWFLVQDNIVDYLQTIAEQNTSAYPSIKPNDIHRLKLDLPPLPEQRAIAHILGTLDDKIELNRRMNETLEEMARALFKSWFVDFDPVRAKMEGRWRRGESLPGMPAELYELFPGGMVDSELGTIPAGWEVRALSSFGEIVTGKTPSTREPAYFGGEVPFLRIPDMHGKMYALRTQMMLSTLGADSQRKKTLPPGSVSVSCIATPGLVILNHRHTQTNQQINNIIPSEQIFSKYLYWYCKFLSSYIRTGGLGGTVFGNMNKTDFSALLALYPKPVAIRAFDQFVSPLHATILSLEERSQILAQMRDTLLPKLISGELSSTRWNATKESANTRFAENDNECSHTPAL